MRLVLSGIATLIALVLAWPSAAETKYSRFLLIEKNASAPPDLSLSAELTKLGTIDEGAWESRRVVKIPDEAIAKLRAHPLVKYLQPVRGGWVTPATTSQSASLRPATDGLRQESDGAGVWSSGDYQFDGGGNISAIGTTTAPNSYGKRNVYNYDAFGRLVSAGLNHSTSNSELYSYDGFGNLTAFSTTENGQQVTRSIVIDGAKNQATSVGGTALRYDAVGNLIEEGPVGAPSVTYEYDAMNTLVRKSGLDVGEELYIYDANDERVGVQGPTTTRWMIRDLEGRVVREYESSTSNPSLPWLWLEDYIYKENQLFAAEREPLDGGRRYFHPDHLGTPRLITRENGELISTHDYYPFGIERTLLRQETDRGYDRVEPRKFTGHERDLSSGTVTQNTKYIDYMHARYYSPVSGRFLSVDPVINIKEALREPQLWNRYSYVTNNPLKYTDPNGRYRDFYTGPGAEEREVGDWSKVPAVSWAFYAQGALLTAGAGQAGLGLLRSGMAWYRAATFKPAIETTGVTLTLTQAKRIGTINEIVHNWDARRTLQATGEVLVQHQQKLKDGVAGLQRAATSLQASLTNHNLDPAARAVMERALKYAEKYMREAQKLLDQLK